MRGSTENKWAGFDNIKATAICGELPSGEPPSGEFPSGELPSYLLTASPSGIEFVGLDWDDDVPSSQPSSTPNTDGDLDCAGGDGVIITFEDFESSDQAESWKGSQLSDGFGSSFLGQIDQQNPQVSKAFTVPITASSLDLSFDLYKTKNYNFAPHEDVSPEKKEMKEKKKMKGKKNMKAMKKNKSVKFKAKRNSERSLKSRRKEKMKSLKTKSKPIEDEESKTMKKKKKSEKKKFFIGIQDVEHELEMIGSSGSSHQSGISYSFQRDTENVQIFHVDVSIPLPAVGDGPRVLLGRQLGRTLRSPRSRKRATNTSQQHARGRGRMGPRRDGDGA